VMPKRLRFNNKAASLLRIAERYKENKDKKWHVIYFANHVMNIKEYIIPFLMNQGIPEECIAVSHSKNKNEFNEIISNNGSKVEDGLAKDGIIPDDIKIFITTSKNKEGININNKDCVWDVFIESHWKDEIQQMWGRIRNNLDEVTIIYNARQHISYDIEGDYDYHYAKVQNEDASKALDKWSEYNKYPLKRRFTHQESKNKIEKLYDDRYPYLRYSTIYDKFKKYKGKIRGVKSLRNSVLYFKKFIRLCEQGYRPNKPFGIDVEYEYANPVNTVEMLERYFQDNGFCEGSLITKRERDKLLKYINDVLLPNMGLNKKYKQCSFALHNFGYSLKETAHNTSNPLYGCSILIKYEKKKDDNGGT
ncbi:MAG: hypothetical protein IJO16_08995, partial [Clostridia bacterium]|nr:hypothetical protein [Clostridia bacterium]